jgi:hypothetical protein
MNIRRHVSELFRNDKLPAPWNRMILCGIGTCIPLIAGIMNGELGYSLYGALTGYLVALNDHLGRFTHRLWTTTLTFLIMLSGVAFGYHLQSHELAYYICIIGLAYWLGVLAGEGAEIEKAVLFAAIGVVIAHSATQLLPQSIPAALFYITLSYATLMVSMPLLILITKSKPDPYRGIRESLRKSFTKQREKHIHAASYALAILFSIWLYEHFQIERGYWITVTVFLVMKPNPRQSLYVTLQRLIGTAMGVLFVDGLIQVVHSSSALATLIVTCAFLVPWAFKRNYWIVTFFVTVMVVLLIELAATQHGQFHTAFLRLKATLIGCTLSLIATSISRTIAYLERDDGKAYAP